MRIPMHHIEVLDYQGKSINTAKKEYYFQKIPHDLGQMYLINGRALIARSSSQILFFKIERDEFT